ncbi:MAG: hypothetical protein IVW52_19070 [Acidimicrobiales bacterium]|nr:hypothetical protein [Acidimicrobiales bacterium]
MTKRVTAKLHGPEIRILYTRQVPEAWPRPPARLTRNDLPSSVATATSVFVCGSSGFSDAATDSLLSVGVPAEDIRIERFGPTR